MNQLKQYAMKTYKERKLEREINEEWIEAQAKARVIELLWESEPGLSDYTSYYEFSVSAKVELEYRYSISTDRHSVFIIKFESAAPIKVTMVNYGPLANQYEVATRIRKTYGTVWGESFNSFIEALGYAFEIWNNQYASDYYDYMGLK